MRIVMPNHSDVRTIEKFLIIPKTLFNSKGQKEFRWLEKALVTQVYDAFNRCWTDTSFADEK